MKTPIVIIAFLAIIAVSCSKETVKCDSSQICVVNTGNDTIMYCWGCNSYTEVLLPGGSACLDTGPLEVEKGADFASVYSFDSDHGTYPIKLNDCYIEQQVN